MASAVNVIPGFSLTNRWLLYTSLMLCPSQAISGIGSHCISNLGFLAFNYYQQYIWFVAARDRQLHALSLLPFHLNIIYGMSYLAGVPSGNYVLIVIQALATVGLLLLNNIAAWVSYKRDLVEGLGTYQFFFFGWRTLSTKWMRFFLVWNLGDTFLAIAAIFTVISLTIQLMIASTMGICPCDSEGGGDSEAEKKAAMTSCALLVTGPVLMLCCIWPLIMWVELIVKRNHIVSETDMVSVYLFITQAVLLVASTIINIISGAAN